MPRMLEEAVGGGAGGTDGSAARFLAQRWPASVPENAGGGADCPRGAAARFLAGIDPGSCLDRRGEFWHSKLSLLISS